MRIVNKTKQPKPKFYAKISTTYGDNLYVQCWNRTWNSAVKQIYDEFVMIDKVTEIKESTFNKHKND